MNLIWKKILTQLKSLMSNQLTMLTLLTMVSMNLLPPLLMNLSTMKAEMLPLELELIKLLPDAKLPVELKTGAASNVQTAWLMTVASVSTVWTDLNSVDLLYANKGAFTKSASWKLNLLSLTRDTFDQALWSYNCITLHHSVSSSYYACLYHS